MGAFNKFIEILNIGPKLNFKVGKMNFEPSLVNAAMIIFLLFVLVLTLAQVRRHFINWSFRGSIFGLFLGFLLALILEGFLLIGGKTALTSLFGWKNPPKAVSGVLDAGHERLIQVLGVNSECK